jgi:predicted TIM-barrel fold metal-dependent hydrolase
VQPIGQEFYPHPEYDPDVVEELHEAIEPLSEDARHDILWRNADRLYGLGLAGGTV